MRLAPTEGAVVPRLAGLAGGAAAAGGGKLLRYGGAGQGKVGFDGRRAFNDCGTCHRRS